MFRPLLLSVYSSFFFFWNMLKPHGLIGVHSLFLVAITYHCRNVNNKHNWFHTFVGEIWFYGSVVSLCEQIFACGLISFFYYWRATFYFRPSRIRVFRLASVCPLSYHSPRLWPAIKNRLLGGEGRAHSYSNQLLLLHSRVIFVLIVCLAATWTFRLMLKIVLIIRMFILLFYLIVSSGWLSSTRLIECPYRL
jgi:hypothetical protein